MPREAMAPCKAHLNVLWKRMIGIGHLDWSARSGLGERSFEAIEVEKSEITEVYM